MEAHNDQLADGQGEDTIVATDAPAEEKGFVPRPPTEQRILNASRRGAYGGVHMRGSVWPSKRMDPPDDHYRALTKREKAALRKAGKPVTTTVRLTGDLRANGDQVKAFVTSVRDHVKSPGELAGLFGLSAGYSAPADAARFCRRAARWARSDRSGTKPPAHIRRGLLLMDATVQGIKLAFPDHAAAVALAS